MKIYATRKERIEVEITPQELSHAIAMFIVEQVGAFDDAGCDWCTENGKTYVAYDVNWHISDDPNIATLVDAMNIISLGKVLKLND